VYVSVFVLGGFVIGHYVFPRYLNPFLDRRFPEQPSASIQPRDQAQTLLFVAVLVLFAWIGEQIGSHLIGAFVAGLCFVDVPRSTLIMNGQFKRILVWLMRLFFGATVAFGIPLCRLFDPAAFTNGLIITVVSVVAAKVIAGLPAGRDRLVVGCALVGRGEFGFLILETAFELGLVSPLAFASVVWGLVWSVMITPPMFRQVLKRRYKVSVHALTSVRQLMYARHINLFTRYMIVHPMRN
jgi:Kef-type K+ transport system membrane component KefB